MLLIKQVTILHPKTATVEVADILIGEGVIQAIKAEITDIPPETITIAGKGLILGPGLVDLYSYSGEPGYETRETLSSLAAAARNGGFTRLSILPHLQPVVDNAAVLQALRQKVNCFPQPPQFQFWGCLTVGHQGQQMTEMAEMASQVVGFSDGNAISDLNLVKRLLEYGQYLGKTIALVPVNLGIQGNGVMREGVASTRLGLPGNPEVAETTAIAAILELVATLNTPVHLMRISTARGVELISQGKSRGLPITASTTWMHLLYDTEAINSYTPNLRLEPPLGNPTDVKALRTGVQTGVIEAIAVDHTPYNYEEKTVAFAEAPPGVIGLELALPCLWQELVVQQQWSPLQLWQALSTNPCLCLGDTPMNCQVGEKAEVTLFDPQATWVVKGENWKSLAKNTPLWGKTITGKIIATDSLGSNLSSLVNLI